MFVNFDVYCTAMYFYCNVLECLFTFIVAESTVFWRLKFELAELALVLGTAVGGPKYKQNKSSKK